MKNQEYYPELDYFGILDADCFPDNDYYKKLLIFLVNKKKAITVNASTDAVLESGENYTLNLSGDGGSASTTVNITDKTTAPTLSISASVTDLTSVTVYAGYYIGQ